MSGAVMSTVGRTNTTNANRSRGPENDAARNFRVRNGFLCFGQGSPISLGYSFKRGVHDIRFGYQELQALKEILDSKAIPLSNDLRKVIFEATDTKYFRSGAQFITYMKCLYLETRLDITIPRPLSSDLGRLADMLRVKPLTWNYHHKYRNQPELLSFFDELYWTRWRRVNRLSTAVMATVIFERVTINAEDDAKVVLIEEEAGRLWIKMVLERYPALKTPLLTENISTYVMMGAPAPWGIDVFSSLTASWFRQLNQIGDTLFDKLMKEIVPRLREEKEQADFERAMARELIREIESRGLSLTDD